MSIQAGFGSIAGTGISKTPADYGTDLQLFLDGEQGLTESAGDVTAWLDQSGNAISFTVPGGDDPGIFLNNTQNGLDGVSFLESPTNNLDRKLSNSANALDNFFGGAGFKAISFAARIDDIATSFGVRHQVISKGAGEDRGWGLDVAQDGTVRFRHFRDNGSIWELEASGFYSEGDLLLGSVQYSGGNTTGSGTFTLYNGSTFVETGTVSVGSGTRDTDSAFDCIIGNILDTVTPTDNRPFGGPLLGIWMTKPAATSFDQGYFQRWIP